MSIWGKILGTAVGLAIGGPLGALAGLAAGHAIDVGAARLGRGERAQVAFTIAAIALSAKMARADGYASTDEFAVFERLFQVEAAERANAERFYNLAKRSTDGFESYARQVRSIIGTGSPVLEDLVEALLMIAVADGVTREELEYVDRVRREFAISDADFARIKTRYIAPDPDDPYVVLGVAPGADRETVRRAYLALVKRHHPDRHYAEGTPAEFIRVADLRMAEINAAYRTIMSS
jgi:DnaJ like chaperone protein